MGNCNCFNPAQRINKSKDIMIDDIPDPKINKISPKEEVFESNNTFDPNLNSKINNINNKNKDIEEHKNKLNENSSNIQSQIKSK
jgi:hypothetical protein